MGLQNHVNQRLRTSDCPLTFEFAEHALDDDPRPAQEFVPGTAPANVSQSDGSAIVAMEQSHSCRPVKATPAGKRFSIWTQRERIVTDTVVLYSWGSAAN